MGIEPRALRSLIATLLVALAWGSNASAENMSVFDPVTPEAESIRGVFLLVLAITGVIFLLVEGMLLYCVIRFRRRDPQDTAEPPQLYGSRPIEVAWTVAPILICFVLVLVVFRAVFAIRAPDYENADDPLHVTVIGHQWWWEFRYPDGDGGVVTANELHIPIGDAENSRPIRLDLQSADVVHSFWVPRLAGKTDVIPGRTNRMWLRVDRPDVYFGQCAEYCGTQHANMLIRVVAETPEDFGRWLAAQRGPAVIETAAQAGEAQAGNRLFDSLACRNCHTIRGTSAHGTAGPDLTHLMSRATIGAGVAENDRENHIDWVYDAQQLKPGCLMPSLHLSRDQAERIVSYLETLR